MKTLIIYFSQTGNTHKVAKYIRDGMLDLADSCDLIKMNDVDKNSLNNYDIVGFGCPVYYYKEPFNVSDFLENLPDLKDRHWFLFCTHGAVLGVTLLSMYEKVQSKGIDVIGTHHTYGDAFLPFYPNPTYTTGHPDKQDLNESRAFGKNIVKCHLDVLKGNRECIKKPEPLREDWVRKELPLFDPEVISGIMPKLSVNTEMCIECGDCERSCPVNGIDINASPRKIQDPCIFCWQCVVVCPLYAINTDWSMLVSLAPQNYERYEKALLEAEKRGEFRWQMNRNSIDFDTPLHVKLQWKSDANRHRLKKK